MLQTRLVQKSIWARPSPAEPEESGFWCAGREMPGRARRSPAGPTKPGGSDEARPDRRKPDADSGY